MKTRKLLALLLSLVMAIGLMTTAATATSTTTIDLSQGSYAIETAGEYVVTGGITTTNTLTINAEGDVTVTLNGVTINALAECSAISIDQGNVTLISTGDTNTLTGGDNGAGIYVAADASLTIQGDKMLNATGNNGVDDASGAAGIGGTYANGASGKITIDGATVTAQGFGVWASGIGSAGGYADDITITNGADVYAVGGYYANGAGTKLQSSYGKSDPEGGAAIGGGSKDGAGVGTITITDSEVVAFGGSKAAGIGAMFWNSVKAINIGGRSDVTAQGGSSSAGIGTSRAGDTGVSANITISGGTVEATGGDYGAGIGAGYNADSLGNGADASALPETSITISGGTVTATGGMGGAGIGGGYKTDNVDIDITGGSVTAAAGVLVEGKDIETGGSACAIGTGANGSGVFENSPAAEIADSANVTISNNYESQNGKPAVEGYTYDGSTLTKLWYDANATEYHITCEEDLWDFAETARNLADAGNNPFEGKTVYLDADIDLNWADWYPINFYGTFEGGNHTISNLTYIPRTDGRMGFFQLAAGPVSNLALDGIKGTVPTDGRFGGFARYLNALAENVHVKNIEVTTTDKLAWIGGITTYTAGGRTLNCSVENMTVDATAGADLIAGVVALTSNRQLYENTDVKGFKVTVTDTDDGCGVGGFAGQTQTGWNNPKFKDCDITGIDVTAVGLVDVGGFIAWPGAHTEYATNCTTEGKIDVTGVTSDGCFAGGFFGNLGWNCDLGFMGHVVTDCSADVDITTSIAPAGGFVGSATNSNDRSMYATFTNCTASGDITSTDTASVGGFAGDADRGVYNNCSASGTVSGYGYVGGFIGYMRDTNMSYDGRYPAGTRDYLADDISLTNCTGASNISGADTKKAGLIGYVEEGTKLALNGNNYSVEPQYNPTDAVVTVTVASVTDSEDNVTYYETVQGAIDAAKNMIGDVTISLFGNHSNITPITLPAGMNVTLDASEADFGDAANVKILCHRIADNKQDLVSDRTAGTYMIKNFNIDGSLSVGANAATVTIEGCDVEAMDLNTSNTAVTLKNNKIEMVLDSYTRYDGGNNKYALYVYADNYDLTMTGNEITGKDKAVWIQGNYEQFQKDNSGLKNSISMTKNKLRTTDAADDAALIKILNDVTYAPVERPDDYSVTEQMKTLTKQILEQNDLEGTCMIDVLNILCRANGKSDIDVTENHALLKDIAEAAAEVNSRHDWGAWVVTTPATTTAKGVETSTCQVTGCGETQTRDIAMLPSVPSSSGSSEPSYQVKNEVEGLKSSHRTAEEGDTVTLTVKDGYDISDIVVTDKNGDEVKLTYKNGKYTFKMPKGGVTVTASDNTDVFQFEDVDDGYWAEDEIYWAHDEGLMNGNTATTFNPNGLVTRQQVWMILARMSGYAPEDMAAAKGWAVSTGVSDGSNPGNAVTRQQLVTLIWRAEGEPEGDVSVLANYPDAGSVSEYAKEAMAWAVENGVIGGTAQGTLNPHGNATRAQLAAILYRYVG